MRPETRMSLRKIDKMLDIAMATTRVKHAAKSPKPSTKTGIQRSKNRKMVNMAPGYDTPFALDQKNV